MDLLLNQSTGDMVFINGACPITERFEGAVCQRLYVRLRTLLSEWFLDSPYGVPYLERILGHKVPKSTVDLIFQEQILKDSGVSQITAFSSHYGVDRKYTLTFRVRTTQGVETQDIRI